MQKYMKTKKFLVIKILCFALSGFLLSSSVFMSNQKAITVNAMDEEEYNHLLRCITAVAAVIGIWNIPAGIIFEAVSVVGVSVVDFIQDNGDGTYTIDAELIQAVNEIICKDYIDGQVEIGDNGFYNYGASELYFHRIETDPNNGNQSEIEQKIRFDGFNTKNPVVAIIQENSSTPLNMAYYIYTLRGGSVYTLSASDMGNVIGKVYIDNLMSGTTTTFANYTYGGASGLAFSCNYNDSQYEFTYSIPFPVFDSITTGTNALLSGDYTDAINYRAKVFETSGRFTGLPYTGGDVTVTYNVLNGIDDKITELDETDKTTDEKIDELLDYIKDDDTSPDNPPDNPPADDDDDDNGGGGFSGFLKGLSAIGDAILSILGKVMEYIGKAIELLTNTLMNVIEIIPTNFTNLLTALFPFFPHEWVVAVELLLVLAVILVVVKAFK